MTTGHDRRGKHINFGLLLHNHQPVGNFPWVFQQVYEESYLPMIEALERHPGIRLSLHYTGSLLDWFSANQPAFIKRVGALVRRKQIEIVGGGYYEPILPAIPDSDKVGQIQHLTARIERDFGVKPDGMWIAERVWEPGLPRQIKEASMDWIILDDIHFKNVGFDDSDLYGYYATEDQGSVVKVYATSKALRYTIPFRPAAETIKTLQALASSDGERIIVMGDDGEKFGSWPETAKYCWGSNGHSGWVDEFFQALEQNQDWLHTIPLGEYARTHPALGRAYIPTASYIEMTEWALPPQKAHLFGKLLHQLEDSRSDDLQQFMRGGFWRNFLVRYDEINTQHKKMLRVHDRVYAAGATEKSGLHHLWKGQANDTYWHGLFGGIYMAHVRSAIYHHLIKAENAADRLLHGETTWQSYEFCDFARDTQAKLIVESDQQNLYIDPLHGGTLIEWDLRRSAHNVLSVMTRRNESYHQTLREHEQERRRLLSSNAQRQGGAHSQQEPQSPHTTIRTKEDGLDQHLVVDRLRRSSLQDHFLPTGLPLASFAAERYEELGDFAGQPYSASAIQEPQALIITLMRNGQVKRAGALPPVPVQLTKTLTLPAGEEKLLIRYTIENRGQARLQTNFASEWNFNLLGGGNNPQAYYRTQQPDKASSHFDSNGQNTELQTFQIGNSWLEQELDFQISQPASLWHFSIDTVTGSEAGFERTHQGSCITLFWPLQLDEGASWHVEISVQGCKPAG